MLATFPSQHPTDNRPRCDSYCGRHCNCFNRIPLNSFLGVSIKLGSSITATFYCSPGHYNTIFKRIPNS